MRISFTAALVLGLAAESAVASSWFSKAGESDYEMTDSLLIMMIWLIDLSSLC